LNPRHAAVAVVNAAMALGSGRAVPTGRGGVRAAHADTVSTRAASTRRYRPCPFEQLRVIPRVVEGGAKSNGIYLARARAALIFFSIAPRSICSPSPARARSHAATASA